AQDAVRSARHPRERCRGRRDRVSGPWRQSAPTAESCRREGVRADRALHRRPALPVRPAACPPRHGVPAQGVEKNRRDRVGPHPQLRRARARAGLGRARRRPGVRSEPDPAGGSLPSRPRRRRNRRLRAPRGRLSSVRETLAARPRGGARRAVNAHNAALLDEFCYAVWLEDGVAKTTLESYRRDLSLFALWHERQGAASLLSATESDLAAYLASRSASRGPGAKRGIRSSTQARLHSSLKRFYQFFARGGRVPVDPTLQLEAPKKPPRFPRVLSEDDVEALLARPDAATPLGLRDRAMLEALYASGLRVSELVGLKLAQLSFDMGVVRVFGKGSKERLV